MMSELQSRLCRIPMNLNYYYKLSRSKNKLSHSRKRSYWENKGRICPLSQGLCLNSYNCSICGFAWLRESKVVITHNTKIPEHKIYSHNKSGILKRKSKWRERKDFTVIWKFTGTMLKSFPLFKIPGNHNDYCSPLVIIRILMLLYNHKDECCSLVLIFSFLKWRKIFFVCYFYT